MLWVKGSGGDLGSMKLDGFATLYQDKLDALKALYRGPAHEDEMVGYLPHCTFNLNPRAASIDTPLHGFLPYHACRPHASRRGDRHRRVEELAGADKEIYGDSIGWLPWRRPGFELGLMLEKFARAHPEAVGVVLGKPRPVHLGRGRPSACYETTIATINRRDRLARREERGEPVFGGAVTPGGAGSAARRRRG